MHHLHRIRGKEKDHCSDINALKQRIATGRSHFKVNLFHDDNEQEGSERITLPNPFSDGKFLRMGGSYRDKTTPNQESPYIFEYCLHYDQVEVVPTKRAKSLVELNFEQEELIFRLLNLITNFIYDHWVVKDVTTHNKFRLDFISQSRGKSLHGNLIKTHDKANGR